MRASVTLRSLVVTAICLCGCNQGPAAQPGTPEFAIEAAASAAKNRDYSTYAQSFTEKYQRDAIEWTFFWLKPQVPMRESAINKGPQAVQAVDAVLANENKVLKLLGVKWDRLIEISKLPSEDKDAAYEEVLNGVKDPASVWAGILNTEGETPAWYGPIESVSEDGDEATVKTYVKGETLLPLTIKLRKVNGEWKIDGPLWRSTFLRRPGR